MWLERTGRQWKGSKVTEGLAPCCRTVERSWPRKMPLRPRAVTQPLHSRYSAVLRAHRAAGARYASGPEVEKRLDRLIRRDAAPEVRAAALRRRPDASA